MAMTGLDTRQTVDPRAVEEADEKGLYLIVAVVGGHDIGCTQLAPLGLEHFVSDTARGRLSVLPGQRMFMNGLAQKLDSIPSAAQISLARAARRLESPSSRGRCEGREARSRDRGRRVSGPKEVPWNRVHRRKQPGACRLRGPQHGARRTF